MRHKKLLVIFVSVMLLLSMTVTASAAVSDCATARQERLEEQAKDRSSTDTITRVRIKACTANCGFADCVKQGQCDSTGCINQDQCDSTGCGNQGLCGGNTRNNQRGISNRRMGCGKRTR